ncbi:LytTR family DNA-binding domain-containing protein [Flavobacteriaceae bacterium]|nr:LytTR family DNA-binding domain-containing protein [Flavobacteriaceae bacterium]MDC1540587.1 LytTR family DNA-binding domain-containing protein [Flavobacteriaceae bacterium]
MMSKISTILVDDEIKNNELLSIYLDKYCPKIEVVGIATTVEDAINKINGLQPNLIFLDIVLHDGTGFDVLEGVQHNDFSVVFITAFQEYAVTAFKFNAIDFLLKPIDPKDLITTVNTIEENIKNKLYTTTPQLESAKTSIATKTSDYNFIAIPSTKKIDFIKIDDILYFESDGRYTIIHLMDQTTFFVSKNIGEYDKILAPNYFFRIHKKYLINLKYIININNSDGSNCELVGNLKLPVAKRRKEDLVSFLNIK